MHHIDCYFLYFVALTLSNVVCPWFSLFSFFGFYFYLSFPTFSIMVRKTRANTKTTSTSTSTLAFDSERFRFEKNQETYKKLNIFRSIWAKRKVILDELDPEIRRNFERRGWLPLLDISHPLLAALIREFYSNLSVHSDDSNTYYAMSWIRGEEYTITPSVATSALGYLWNDSQSTLIRRPLLLMTLCHISPVVSFSGVLILVSPPMSLLRFIIYFFGFLVILSGLSFICTPFLL